MEVDGIFHIDDYCYIIKSNNAYLLVLYDEEYYLYCTEDMNDFEKGYIYHLPYRLVAYSDNNINIDPDVIDQFKPFIKTYKPKSKPTHLHLAYVYSKYDKEKIATYNVTDYLRLFTFSSPHRMRKEKLLSYNITAQLDLMREISASYTGIFIENIIYAYIHDINASYVKVMDYVIKNTFEHQKLFDRRCNKKTIYEMKNFCFRHHIIFKYCKDVVKRLNIKTATCDFDNAYLTLAGSYALRSSPDLVINDEEIYDIKVTYKLNKGIKQLYLYIRGYEQNYGKVSRSGILNIYWNEIIFVEYDNLHRVISDSLISETKMESQDEISIQMTDEIEDLSLARQDVVEGWPSETSLISEYTSDDIEDGISPEEFARLYDELE